MNSLVLSAATRLLAPLMLAFSLFILLRGHNEPGGGFIGGLIAATAFALYAKAEGLAAARRALRFEPMGLALAGLGAAVLAGVWGWLARGAFLAGVWPLLEIGPDGEKTGLPVGSALIFDIGVYLVVVGAVTGLFLALEEDAARAPDPVHPPTRPGEG
ncbi:MAG: MnhB domain-containing protein [Rubrimonas sp.]|uniref:MnhB domain-containing protein n=1 Tax=Rubrimonas sp. TaxID=2036015 RepID=UPI002FDEA7F8